MRKRQLFKFAHLPDVHIASDSCVINSLLRYQQPSGNASGLKSEIEQIDYRRLVMQDEHLTADEREELSQFLRQDAAAMPSGPRKRIC